MIGNVRTLVMVDQLRTVDYEKVLGQALRVVLDLVMRPGASCAAPAFDPWMGTHIAFLRVRLEHAEDNEEYERRMLHDIDAQRLILEEFQATLADDSPTARCCLASGYAARMLAAVFAGHPRTATSGERKDDSCRGTKMALAALSR